MYVCMYVCIYVYTDETKLRNSMREAPTASSEPSMPEKIAGNRTIALPRDTGRIDKSASAQPRYVKLISGTSPKHKLPSHASACTSRVHIIRNALVGSVSDAEG